jgi:flagellar hook-length control protein FliK
MIAVPTTSSAGVFPQTQADAALVADDSIANPGFIDLLTLLGAALQPQPAPSDSAVSDGEDAAALLTPDRDRPTEYGDAATTDPSLIAGLLAQFHPSDFLGDVSTPLNGSADLDAARAIIPAQTLEAPAQDSNEAVAHPFAVNVSEDAKAATAAKLPTNGAELSGNEKSLPAADRSAHETIPLEPIDAAKQKVPLSDAIEVHANSSAIVDAPAVAMKSFSPADGQHRTSAAAQQTRTSSAPNNEALTIEAPTRQLTVASQAQSSFADNDAESFGQQGKFKSSEAVVELSDSATPRFAHVQPEAGVTPSRQLENIANENGATPWRPVLDRVAQEIKTHIQFGEHEAVIQLDPPELGKIKIDLRLDGEHIHARIVAEEPSTQALIENHWADLRQALDPRQVDFVNVQFDRQTASSGSGQWSQAFNDAPAQGQERGAGANAEQTAHGAAEAVDQGRISMWV